jgi:hypothetical protein
VVDPHAGLGFSIGMSFTNLRANSQDHLATTALKFLGDLRAGHAATYGPVATTTFFARITRWSLVQGIQLLRQAAICCFQREEYD